VSASVYEQLRDLLRAEEPVALATVVNGPRPGAKLLVRPEGEPLGQLGDPGLDRVVGRDARAQLQAGLTGKNLLFSDEAIKDIIRSYTREAGVRNLEREIGNVCRKVARKVVKEGAGYSVTLTDDNVNDFLGVLKFRDTLAHEKSEIGLVTGLAWTEVGGSILSTEATVVDGKGKLTLTGKLGDVMQESAQAAMSYIRSRAVRLGLPRDFYRNIDVHIHVPEGAIPKDGPSAGITMATALASALTSKKR